MAVIAEPILDYFIQEKKKDVFTAAGLVVDWFQFTVSPVLSEEAQKNVAKTSSYIAFSKDIFAWPGIVEDSYALVKNSYSLFFKENDTAFVLVRIEQACVAALQFVSTSLDAVDQLQMGLGLIDLGKEIIYVRAGSALATIFAEAMAALMLMINLVVDPAVGGIKSGLGLAVHGTCAAGSVLSLISLAVAPEQAALLAFLILTATTANLVAKISLYVYTH